LKGRSFGSNRNREEASHIIRKAIDHREKSGAPVNRSVELSGDLVGAGSLKHRIEVILRVLLRSTYDNACKGGRRFP
jgi:hypothetical protein